MSDPELDNSTHNEIPTVHNGQPAEPAVINGLGPEPIKSDSRQFKFFKKIANFFYPPWRKLILILLLTTALFGGLILINKNQYNGTSKGTKAESTAIFDVLVYDNTTSGISAVKALNDTALSKNITIKVLWLSDTQARKAMAENGLGIEDLYDGSVWESGNLKLFRRGIDNYYSNLSRQSGIPPYILSDEPGRQTYENLAARTTFDNILSDLNNLTITYVTDVITNYTYNPDGTGTVTTAVNPAGYIARYFIDSSVEADLARKMGAGYRLGMNETVFNDITNPIRLENIINCTKDGSTRCTPEAVTALATLEQSTTVTDPGQSFSSVYSDNIIGTYDINYLKKQFQGWNYLTNSYSRTLKACNINHMVNTPIPQGRTGKFLYEFNQHWNDYRIGQGIFDWYMDPSKRNSIRQEVIGAEVEAVRYLQNNCASQGIYNIYELPANIYVRGEMRIDGSTYMTTTGQKEDSIAIGYYSPYDRRAGDFQVDNALPPGANNNYAIEVPYGSLVPNSSSAAIFPALKNLIVSTAISTDYKTYNTSIRMEATRMYMGEAAGTAAALAKYYNVKLSAIKNNDVQSVLKEKTVPVKVFISGDTAARTANINASPVITSASPAADASYLGNTSITVSATATDPTDNVQAVFRLVKDNNCSSSLTSPWTNLSASGATFNYTFSDLTPGVYIWGVKIRDGHSPFAYSIGGEVCTSDGSVTDGWAIIQSFTIKPKPSCRFDPASYTVYAGNRVALYYATSNAISALICSSGGTCKTTTADAANTFKASPVESVTYTLTVKNSYGDNFKCYASVTVKPNNNGPMISSLSPANNANITGSQTRLTARITDAENDNVQAAFRIALNGDCALAKTSAGPWTPWQASPSNHAYTFTGLAPGKYFWASKARDTNGYSNGITFCGSSGWTDVRSFTISR